MPSLAHIGPKGTEVKPLAAAAASGFLFMLAYPPWRLWPLAFVYLVPLLWSLGWVARKPRGAAHAFRLGWLGGFVAFVGILHWILALSNEEVTIPGLMIPSLLLIGAYLGLFWGAASGLSVWASRQLRIPVWALAPGLFALAEFLRSIGPLGFPWAVGPYAVARHPYLLQTGAWIGFWGLTFLFLLANGLFAATTERPGVALLGMALVVGLAGFGAATMHAAASAATPRASAVCFLVLQPDIRREIKWKPEKRTYVVSEILRHATAAADAEAGRFDAIVMPETVFPLRLLEHPLLFNTLASLAHRFDAPILLGTQEGYWQDRGEERVWIAHNSALVIYPDSTRSRPYRKLRLVPFSERMPLQKIVPWLKNIDFGQSDFYPGGGVVLLDLAGVHAGCLICFESAFPELARQEVSQGAGLLVNITNDFWFGRSAGPYQHAEMAVLRAIENRVPLIRCANTGISFCVDPWGRVSHETRLFEQTHFVAEVQAGTGSFASHHPLVGQLLPLLWLALVGVSSGLQRFRGSR